MKDLKYHNQGLSVAVMKTAFNSRGENAKHHRDRVTFFTRPSLESGNKNMNGRTSDNYRGRSAERDERNDRRRTSGKKC